MREGTKRTTVVVDEWWEKAVAKAEESGIYMSQVIRALIKAYVVGDVTIEIEVRDERE